MSNRDHKYLLFIFMLPALLTGCLENRGNEPKALPIVKISRSNQIVPQSPSSAGNPATTTQTEEDVHFRSAVSSCGYSSRANALNAYFSETRAGRALYRLAVFQPIYNAACVTPVWEENLRIVAEAPPETIQQLRASLETLPSNYSSERQYFIHLVQDLGVNSQDKIDFWVSQLNRRVTSNTENLQADSLTPLFALVAIMANTSNLNNLDSIVRTAVERQNSAQIKAILVLQLATLSSNTAISIATDYSIDFTSMVGVVDDLATAISNNSRLQMVSFTPNMPELRQDDPGLIDYPEWLPRTVREHLSRYYGQRIPTKLCVPTSLAMTLEATARRSSISLKSGSSWTKNLLTASPLEKIVMMASSIGTNPDSGSSLRGGNNFYLRRLAEDFQSAEGTACSIFKNCFLDSAQVKAGFHADRPRTYTILFGRYRSRTKTVMGRQVVYYERTSGHAINIKGHLNNVMMYFDPTKGLVSGPLQTFREWESAHTDALSSAAREAFLDIFRGIDLEGQLTRYRGRSSTGTVVREDFDIGDQRPSDLQIADLLPLRIAEDDGSYFGVIEGYQDAWSQ